MPAASPPLFSVWATNTINGMENNRNENNTSGMSPAEARAALETVSDISASAHWKPRPWAIALMALLFTAVVTTSIWHLFGWAFGFFAVLAALLFLLRTQLINPYVRQRPWQPLDRNQDGQKKKWVIEAWWVWVPTTILIPPEPRWIGLLLGVLAGLHIFYSFTKGGVPG